MKKTIAFYGQIGHHQFPEDTWESESVVNNTNDVFEFMKNCYIIDARNRNDYPVISCWDEWVKFYEQEYEVCNLGHTHYGKKTEIKAPEYYEAAKELYNTWKSRIQNLVPRLRKVYKLKKKELNERIMLADLQAKYNSVEE